VALAGALAEPRPDRAGPPALYQRSKGRDLFDLWLGLTILKADPEQIVAGELGSRLRNAPPVDEIGPLVVDHVAKQ